MQRGKPNIIECRSCGTDFNLNAQQYYNNLCPDCIPEQYTWPKCFICRERIPPDVREKMVTPSASRSSANLRVTVHESCKGDEKTTDA